MIKSVYSYIENRNYSERFIYVNTLHPHKSHDIHFIPFFKDFFLIWAIFKVSIVFCCNIASFFYVLALRLRSM